MIAIKRILIILFICVSASLTLEQTEHKCIFDIKYVHNETNCSHCIVCQLSFSMKLILYVY